MHVLMISGDPHILREGSEAHARFMLQKSAVDRLDAVVWPKLHSWSEVVRMAREHQYDVVTAQDPFWRGLLGWWVARRIGAKLNIQVHTDLAAQSFLRRLLSHLVLRHADSVRVVSDTIRQQLVRLGVSVPITVLPVFTDVTPFIGLTHTSHPRFAKTIVWIGRFESEKDPLAALTILQNVRASGVDAGLIMLGAGSMEERLRARAESLHGLVEFPGWQHDITPFLQMADVVISTSRHESYGVSMIVSLAARVPVVAPDIGIAREAGAIVAERSALAQAVVDVLREGSRSTLQLTLPTKEEWVKQWRATL